MNWALEEEQEADDLFSNCSSRKRDSKALQELNSELKQPKGKSVQAFHKLTTIEEVKPPQKARPDAVVPSGKAGRSGSREKLTSRSIDKQAAKTEGNFRKK